MTTQPQGAEILDAILEPVDERGYGLLTMTAQQAVLPRRLEEGVYAILDADGGIQIRETDGYTQRREHEWEQARSDQPEFIHRNVSVLDIESFVDYVAHNTKSTSFEEVDDSAYDHGSGELELWANVDQRKITAILDGFCGMRKHTAALNLKLSREWGEWLAIDGKLLSQTEFAEFIQDHISTIAAPDGGLLVDICETLTGKTDVAWKSQSLSGNGQRKFSYEEVVDGKAGPKGDLPIPTELTLVLRPFQGGEAIAIVARFRYRMREGHLAMGVKLVEPEKALEDAFAQIVAEVQNRMPVHVNHGSF